MRVRHAALPLLFGFLLAAGPALADSVAVTSGSGGSATVTSNGKPCRVVTEHGGSGSSTNSTSITTGAGGVSGSTTVSPGSNGTSVTVGSGSGSDCVIHRRK
ncbi:MAG: hypothetical protein ACM3JG_08050 [Thiohalocapsa sp.]